MHEPHRVRRGHAFLGEGLRRSGHGQEAVAEQSRVVALGHAPIQQRRNLPRSRDTPRGRRGQRHSHRRARCARHPHRQHGRDAGPVRLHRSVGTTDDGRVRRLAFHLPAACARRLFGARDQGAADRDLRAIVAEGLQEIYFKDGGTRAAQRRVEFTAIDYFDVPF
ncbi:telomere-protecting terminal protein Tpg [Streptomyces sp. NPDC057686]|uniref:telomere-protecting terminal protein Tpg n=1 Tax=Streptomyces sp. NPDC057686 TaxID=3346212 RepID=UPI0036B8EBBA